MDPELARLTLDEARLLEFQLPDWFWERFRFRIASIEVTQAIQYNRAASHLTDPADQGADNSVRLVVGKAAWVRVYVRAGWRSADIPGVTGTLRLSRRIGGFYYPAGSVLSPQPPGTVTARSAPPYATERGTLGYSLNFIIPANSMCGHLRLTASVQTPGGATDTMTIYLEVTLQQTLRLAGIMVGYNGPANSNPGAPTVTLAAPTLAALQTTAATTLLMFPVRAVGTYRTAGTITWGLPLTDAPSCPGCCTPNWVALNNAVDAQRTADGNRSDVLYYGLMAPGIPMGPIIGCNTGGVCTGSANDGLTMAHELGHACGFQHAPCGTPGDPDTPAYEPYDPAGTAQASIGEYGLNTSNGSIPSPATFKDMMAYCAPRWISLYNHGRLINHSSLDPVSVCHDHWFWRDYVVYDPFAIPEKWLPDPPPDPLSARVRPHMEPLISVLGVIHGAKEVEVTSVMRVDAEPAIRGGKATGLSVQMVGADGRVLGQGVVHQLRAHACGCGDGDEKTTAYPLTFQAFLPDLKEGAALRLIDGDNVLWDRKAPASRPRIQSFQARVRRRRTGRGAAANQGPTIEAAWEARCRGEGEPEAVIQWSSDRGENWYALGSMLRGNAAALEAGSLPAGRVDLRLLVSDGFYTARSKTVAVNLPPQPPTVSIMAPVAGGSVMAGGSMRLWGALTVPGTAIDLRKVKAIWSIDEKEVANELDAFVTAPRAGKHRARLVVSMQRQRVAVSVDFVSVRVPTEEEAAGKR
ncbi:MAG TPA: hypothetical protein VJP86_07180 [Vicinamibacterales bacterium]|nr:hypothetical protein [Vicinamibacterales bacterium]